MKKIIFVSQRVDKIDNRNEIRDSIDNNLIQFLQNLNLFPIVIPNYKDNHNLKSNISFLFKILKPIGVVLSGGNNIGEFKNRDRLEKLLIEVSIELNIPMLGICRGMQFLNNFFGGTLKKVDNHVNLNHEIFDGLGNKRIVNSFHNYSINKLSDQFNVEFISHDKLIESFSHKTKKIYGIMWHPEREKPFNKIDIDLVSKIFNE